MQKNLNYVRNNFKFFPSSLCAKKEKILKIFSCLISSIKYLKEFFKVIAKYLSLTIKGKAPIFERNIYFTIKKYQEIKLELFKNSCFE